MNSNRPVRMQLIALACSCSIIFPCIMHHAQEVKRLININTASEAEMSKGLPGIGPAKAKAIVEAREKAPFRIVDELELVPGIGPKTMEALRNLVTVGEGNPASQDTNKNTAQNKLTPANGKGAAANNPGASNAKAGGQAKAHDRSLAYQQAYEARLSGMSLAQLHRLKAEKEVAFDAWCSQNNITKEGSFAKGFNATPEKKASIKEEHQYWKLGISLIEKAIKEKTKTSK